MRPPVHVDPAAESPSLRAGLRAVAADGRNADVQASRLRGVTGETALATAEGVVAAGDVRAGMRLVLGDGRVAPVLGCLERAVDGATMARHGWMRPVRISAGALGAGLPARDVSLAPGQAIAVPGGVVTAAALIGRPGVAREAAGAVRYVLPLLPAGCAMAVGGIALRPAWPQPAPVAPAAGREAGRVAGRVERIEENAIVGWAFDPDQPDRRLVIEARLEGRLIGRALADQRRPDLEMAGIGDGAHAFTLSITLPPSARPRLVSVRPAGDGADLPGAPLLLPAPAWTGADLPVAPAKDDATRRREAALLFHQLDRLAAMAAAPEPRTR